MLQFFSNSVTFLPTHAHRHPKPLLSLSLDYDELALEQISI